MCGIYCSDNLSTFEILDQANRERGNFATGIVWINKDKEEFEVIKYEGCVDWNNEEDIPREETIYIGHNQAPTSSQRDYEHLTSHPFIYGDWVVAHNGVLTNYKQLIKDYLPNHDNIVDSSIIPALLDENDYQTGPSTDQDEELANIANVLECLKGTFALWLFNARTYNLYIARQGSTLFYKGTNVSSIKGEGYKEVSEGIIYKYDEKGLTPMEGFVSSSPFFTL